MACSRLGRVLGGRRVGIDENEYTRRRERLSELLASRGVDALFVPPGSDLEYLTGVERDLPTFGNISYAHGWVTGAFLAPGREPVYVLPRMFVRFHLEGRPPPGTPGTRRLMPSLTRPARWPGEAASTGSSSRGASSAGRPIRSPAGG